jgi:hypothetical protein
MRRVSFRVPVRSESSLFVPGTSLADGSFLGLRYLTPPLPSFYRAPELALRRFSADGDIIDTIAVVRQPPAVGDRGFADEFPNRVLTHPLESWTGESQLPVVATRDGTAVVLVGDVTVERGSAAFDLLKIGISGDTLMKRRIRYIPRLIGDSERDEVRDAYAAHFAGDLLSPATGRPASGTAARLREAARQALAFPDYYPPVRQIVTGGDGSIWLLRESAPLPADLWEIYGEDGVLEGALRITEGRSEPYPWTPRLRILRATRDVVWGVTTDDLDVPYLHKYRVDRACVS